MDISNLSKTWNSFKLTFFPKSFWTSRVVLSLLGGSILLNVFVWFFWYFRLRHSGFPIYSPVSLLNVSEWLNFYLLPIVGIAIIILNSILAVYAFKKETLVSFFLLGTSLFIQILILIFLSYFLRYSLVGG